MCKVSMAGAMSNSFIVREVVHVKHAHNRQAHSCSWFPVMTNTTSVATLRSRFLMLLSITVYSAPQSRSLSCKP